MMALKASKRFSCVPDKEVTGTKRHKMKGGKEHPNTQPAVE